MAKAKESANLRQRKSEKVSKDAEVTREEKPSARSPSQKPAEKSPKGMTCMNWFLVFFLIASSSGIVTLLLFKTMQFEIAAVRSKISSIKDIGDEMTLVTEKLDSLKELEKVIAALKEKEAQKSAELKSLTDENEKTSSMFKREIADLRNLVAAVESSKSTESDLPDIKDQLKITTENVAQLIKELSRLDEMYSQHSTQMSSVQQQVTGLSDDRKKVTTAIDSIKSTVVHVRESVKKAEESIKQLQEAKIAEPSFDSDAEFGKRVASELEDLQRQIAELTGNAESLLEKAASEMEGRLQKSIDELSKQVAAVQLKSSETRQSTADQAVINSVASLSEKIERTFQRVSQLGEVIKVVGESQKKTDSFVTEQFGDASESFSSLASKVAESQERDQEMWKAVSDLAEELSKIRDNLNLIKGTADA